MCHVLTKSDEQAKSIRCRSDLICLSFRICIKKPLLLPGEVDVIVILSRDLFLAPVRKGNNLGATAFLTQSFAFFQLLLFLLLALLFHR